MRLDAIRKVRDNPIDTQVAHTPNVCRVIDSIGENQPSQIVIGLKQHGCDARKMQADMRGPYRYDISHGVSRKGARQQDHELGQWIDLSNTVQFIDQK